MRAAVLLLLAEEPRNGYQLMQELGRRSGGVWQPSPGSVYPALQQLEDEALIAAEGGEGRRVYRLTDDGRTYVEGHRDELGVPWEAVSDDSVVEFRGLIAQVAIAAMQVAAAGGARQVAEGRRVLNETRRRLYGILAEAGDEEPADPGS